MAAGGEARDYTVRALARGLKLAEYLAGGDILEWRSIREAAAATGLPENACFRVLETLAAAGWAEKSAKGYRQNSAGLIKHAAYAQDYFRQKLRKDGES